MSEKKSMATPSQTPRNCRRGAAAAELALLLPILTLLLILGIDFGRVFYFYLTITNCARNGAMYACDPTAPTQSAYGSMNSAALADWPAALTPAPTVTGPVNGTDAEGNIYVEVTVTWTFSTITSYLGSAGTQTLSRTARMRLEPLVPN